MSRYSLSAVGQDRPGIVAAVTGVLGDQGCNLQDSTMAILQGQFAILLVVSAPETCSAAILDEALAPVAQRFDLVIAVRALHEADAAGDGSASRDTPATGGASARRDTPATGGGPAAGRAARLQGSPSGAPPASWTIAVHGADRPGIVHGVTAVLAEHGGSVVDLVTHLVGTDESPVYSLVIRAVVPRDVGAALADRVSAVAAELGVHCTMHPDDADLL